MRKILIFLLMLISSAIQATVYNISTQANFDALNTSSLVAGDQVLFERGKTFYGSLTLTKSGTSGNLIYFGAYGTGANPVITGFTSVTAWTNLGSNIWESTNAVSTLSTLNMVTINGVNTAMGRYPNSDAANGGYLTFQTHSGTTSITSSSLTGTPDWTGAEVVIRTNNFVLDRATITSQSTSTINFASLAQGFQPNNGNGFFIQNDARTLDVQNEWYYNPTTKKIRIYSTTQPSNVNVASVEKTITINANYLKFENITFTGTNGATMYCWDSTPRYNHITVKSCNFSYIGAAAINVLIDYLTVDGCLLSTVNGGAISTSYGVHVYLKNNTIQNIGVINGMRSRTYFGTNSAVESSIVSGFVFEYNNISNVGYNGVSFYGDSIRVRYNFIDNFCNTLDDGGAIYTFTGERTAMTDVVINNNVTINGMSAPYGASNPIAPGIYCDEKSSGVEVSYNTVAHTVFSGIFLNQSSNINIHHNTVYDASLYSMRFNAWSPATGISVNNNICVTKGITQKSLYTTNGSSDFPSRYSGNNNIWASPLGNTALFSGENTYSGDLTGWKAYVSPDDANSKGSPVSVSSESDIQFMYNETNTTKTVALTNPSVDMNGTKYVGSITLQPYTSAIYLKDPNPTPAPPVGNRHPVKSGTKYYISNGYIYTL